jgi:hypothetical protein
LRIALDNRVDHRLPKQGGAMRVPQDRDFALNFQAIDALIPKFFQIADLNPRFFDSMLKHVEAEKFFTLRNATPL